MPSRTPQRFFNPTGPDRVAVVSFESAYQKPNQSLIRLARGVSSKELHSGTTFGPYPDAELEGPLDELIAQLAQEGFSPCGQFGLVELLFSTETEVRAKAAIRIGWRREMAGVQPMLELLKNEKSSEICSILDGLGMLGDPAAIPAIRPLTERKLLSRRRSAVEALRAIGDEEGLAAVAQRTLGQLPDPVREAVLDHVPASPTAKPPRPAVTKVVEAVAKVEPKRHGLVCDMLYEMGTPLGIAAARRLLPKLEFDRAFSWRYVKSIFKRAMLRHDAVTFGWIAHAIEARSRTTSGSSATVKSGLDGQNRKTPIFNRRTQAGMKRMAWRYLRRLAAHRPDQYASTAAEVLLRYTKGAEEAPIGLYPALSRCYLLMRILHGESKRFTMSQRSLRFRFVDFTAAQKSKDAPREEAFPDLWDANPMAYLRLLSAAKLIDCQEYAFTAIQERHPTLLQEADLTEVMGLLGSSFEPALDLALDELERRLATEEAHWKLIERLAKHENERARSLAKTFLETSEAWTRDPVLIARFLQLGDLEIRSAVAEIALKTTLSEEDERALAENLWETLTSWKPSSSDESSTLSGDGLEAVSRFCQARLLGYLDLVSDFHALLEVVQRACPSAQSVAARLLARKEEAYTELGMNGLIALASHELATVRSAALGILKAAEHQWQEDPAILFALSESEWDDTRAVALSFIQGMRLTEGPEGFEALVGLMDSNRTDVQDTGKAIVRERFGRVDRELLLARIAEHPSPNVWAFVMELAESEGCALEPLLPVCRASLFHLQPARRQKDRVLALLRKHAMASEDEANLVAALLGDFASTAVRADLEPLLEILVELQLVYPAIETELSIRNAS